MGCAWLMHPALAYAADFRNLYEYPSTVITYLSFLIGVSSRILFGPPRDNSLPRGRRIFGALQMFGIRTEGIPVPKIRRLSVLAWRKFPMARGDRLDDARHQ